MAVSKFDKLSPRVKELEALVAEQAQQIEDMRKARFRIPAGRKKTKGKTFVRLIIPDTHGAHLDKAAARAFLNDVEALKPAEVVWLGDHLDCGGFLAQHQPLSFLPECDYTYADDVAAANEFLDAVAKATGKTESWYIVGNHEARVQKWVVKQTLNNPRDAVYLDKMFGLDASLGLAQRGVAIIERDKQYNGLQKRGTLKLGSCYFTHGKRTGLYAAKQELDDLGGNIVSGHTHRISSFVKDTVHGLIGSWKVGCLCEISPLYSDTRTTGWAHGYGFQVVSPNGQFMHITVPIVEGKSLLGNLWAK